MTTETATTSYEIIDIYTGETVGSIDMTDEQHADYTADCGPTGAVTADRLSGYGDVTELECDAGATVYVRE